MNCKRKKTYDNEKHKTDKKDMKRISTLAATNNCNCAQSNKFKKNIAFYRFITI